MAPSYFSGFVSLSSSFASPFSEHFLHSRHCARLFKCTVLCNPHNNPEPRVLSLTLPMKTACCPSPNTFCTFLPLSFCQCCSHSWHTLPSIPLATEIPHDFQCHAQVLSLQGESSPVPLLNQACAFLTFISVALVTLCGVVGYLRRYLFPPRLCNC